MRRFKQEALLFEKRSKNVLSDCSAPSRESAKPTDKSFLVLFFKKEPLAFLLALLLAGPALADENTDLDMIPTGVNEAPATPPPAAVARDRIAIETAGSMGALRGGMVVPQPGATPARYQLRTSLDGRWQWDLGHDVSATLSNRISVFARDGQVVGEGRTASNDLREAYVTWEAAARSYLEVGRINLRNGVALGFNPTDFFRARSAVDQASADPSALRENRLGTAMVRAQHIADWGTLSLAYAPRLYDPTRLGQAATAPLDPHFDRTNATERMLATLHVDIGDVAPELLLLKDGERTRIGANISAPIGQRVVAYAEWSGGAAQSLIAEAVAYGIRTGTLPLGVPVLPPSGTGARFSNDFAAGFSWTGDSKLTVNVEYLFHEAGLSRTDWRRWYALGHASPALAGEMWYLRGYAADQQMPSARQQLFLRGNLPDAIARDIDLTALSFIDLDDGSAMAQISSTWNIDRQWTAGAYLTGNFGPPRSEHGSLKNAASATLQVQRFF